MSRETLGYVKLEWTCPKCGGRNPGPEKTCISCGAPQPDNVKFEQAAVQELITDEKEISEAQVGPDVHCSFCGTRNPGNAAECTQCGADLSEAAKRQVGRVIGAYKEEDVKQTPCPNCGQNNPETALRCSQCGASTKRSPQPVAAAAPAAKPKSAKKSGMGRYALFAIIGLVAVCIVVFMVLSFNTDDQNGLVQNVSWVTIVEIESLQPATYQAWWDQIPAHATPGACRQQVRSIQDEPAPNSNKVCGTPYSVDTGTGHAEVVQDCQFEVIEDYCEFTVIEWQKVDEARLQGNNLSPEWAEPQLSVDQRPGNHSQIFNVVFQTPDGQISYSPNSLKEFSMFQIGSEWVLNINAFGAILSVEPAR